MVARLTQNILRAIRKFHALLMILIKGMLSATILGIGGDRNPLNRILPKTSELWDHYHEGDEQQPGGRPSRYSLFIWVASVLFAFAVIAGLVYYMVVAEEEYMSGAGGPR